MSPQSTITILSSTDAHIDVEISGDGFRTVLSIEPLGKATYEYESDEIPEIDAGGNQVYVTIDHRP